MLTAFLTVASLLPLQTTEAAAPAAARLTADELAGTWHAALEQPVNSADELRFALWPADRAGKELAGGLRVGEGTALLDGRVDLESAGLTLTAQTLDGPAELELAPAESGLRGTLRRGQLLVELRATRTSPEVADDLRLEVDLAVQRPVTVDRDGLPDFLEEPLVAAIADWVEREGAVGVSIAIVLDREVADVRSVGWQDFAHRTPATQATRYRWGSISKPVTAVAALQLVEGGALDLARDVRAYVPEFPEKRWIVTARDLLCHQAGIVHYQHGPIRTERSYDDANPFRDRILALDMFKESPLLFEPGTAYSYSTHGYSLLGAVVERAGKEAFDAQIRARIVVPLGMTTMQADYHQSVDIPDQTTGYAALADGRTLDSGDSNVAWKVPGGGFLSSVEDLALFGVGLMDDRLLSEEARARMFTRQPLRPGATTDYGLGIQLETIAGFETVGHGGAQRKTRTHLRVVPELGLGVAVMCNTETTNPSALARRLLELMLE